MFETSKVTIALPAHLAKYNDVLYTFDARRPQADSDDSLQAAADTLHVAILFCNVSCVVQMSLF